VYTYAHGINQEPKLHTVTRCMLANTRPDQLYKCTCIVYVLSCSSTYMYMVFETGVEEVLLFMMDEFNHWCSSWGMCDQSSLRMHSATESQSATNSCPPLAWPTWFDVDVHVHCTCTSTVV